MSVADFYLLCHIAFTLAEKGNSVSPHPKLLI